MFASLSTVILYLWTINNGLFLPIIIPILLFLRDVGTILPKNNILHKIFIIQSPMGKNIEYYLALLSSLIILIYYYYSNTDKNNQNNQKIRESLKVIFFSIICIFILLLLINSYTVFN